jgi:hypothetical protein
MYRSPKEYNKEMQSQQLKRLTTIMYNEWQWDGTNELGVDTICAMTLG